MESLSLFINLVHPFLKSRLLFFLNNNFTDPKLLNSTREHKIFKYCLMANYNKIFRINKIQNIRNQGCAYIYRLTVDESAFSICTLETNLWNLHGHQSVGVHFLLSLFPYRKQQPVITRPNVYSINVEVCAEYGRFSVFACISVTFRSKWNMLCRAGKPRFPSFSPSNISACLWAHRIP